jgi:pimeloyl-ACP methyl ester carboxylesterase
VTVNHVQANGLRFAYLEEGSGPLVLLVHGFPDTPHTWDAALPALARAGFRAVAPFTRGYAPTEVPSDGLYDGETLGRDLLALIEALGEKSAIVVGHDWGAFAAYAAVGIDPSKIRMLVTIAIPHLSAVRPTPALVWKGRHMLRLRRKNAAARIRKDELRYIDELVQRWSPGWQVPAGETDAVKRSFAEPGSLEAAVGYYRAMKPSVPRSMRAKVTVPAAAFCGETDMLKLKLYERARSRYTAGYEIVTLPGGHFMHREHPERFVPELLRVVAGAPAAHT